MIIAKFGGGVLSSHKDLLRVANIISSRQPSVVVVSALNGVTDQLVGFIEDSLRGKTIEEEFIKFCKRHQALLKNNPEELEPAFYDLRKMLTGIAYTKEASDRLRAAILSRGEYLSGLILCSYTAGYRFVPTEKLGLVAKGNYLTARCDFQKSRISLSKTSRIITTGFYATNEKQEICLFGRGGSDYSAGAIARLISATKVEFWKNVDGFLTADPKIVFNAKLIHEISFDEAAEICRFGAKILHPSALEPLMGTKTLVETKNVMKPDCKGTLLYESCKKNKIAAVTGRGSISVVSVSGNEMVESFGIAAKIMARVADAGVSVDVIATAQANISFSVEQKDGQNALKALNDLTAFDVRLRENLALIGVVGEGLKTEPAFLSKIFSVLSEQEIQIRMVSQGAMESDLSLIVRKEDYETAIRAIHARLIENS